MWGINFGEYVCGGLQGYPINYKIYDIALKKSKSASNTNTSVIAKMWKKSNTAGTEFGRRGKLKLNQTEVSGAERGGECNPNQDVARSCRVESTPSKQISAEANGIDKSNLIQQKFNSKLKSSSKQKKTNSKRNDISSIKKKKMESHIKVTQKYKLFFENFLNQPSQDERSKIGGVGERASERKLNFIQTNAKKVTIPDQGSYSKVGAERVINSQGSSSSNYLTKELGRGIRYKGH